MEHPSNHAQELAKQNKRITRNCQGNLRRLRRMLGDFRGRVANGVNATGR